MRHIGIAHNSSCDGFEGSNEAWVADDFDDEAIAAALVEIKGKYLEHLRALPGTPPPGPETYAGVEWEKQRQRLVGDVLDERAEQQRARRAWEADRAARAKRFSDFLFADPRFVGEDPDAVEIDLDWGHLHSGLPIKFS